MPAVRTLLGGALVGVAFAAIALALDDGDGTTSSAIDRVRNAPAVGRPVVRVIAARDLAPDVEHRYAVELEHATGGGDPDRAFRIAVAGTWAVRVVASDERDDVVYVAALRDARVSVAGRGRSAVDADLAAELATPHTFTVSADGRLVALGVAPAISVPARSVLATVAASSQIAGTPSAAGWEADESDALGTYRAAYRLRAENELAKTKLRYAPSELGVSATVVASTTTIAVRDDGWPGLIEGADVVVAGLGDVAIEVASRFRVEHVAAVGGVTGDPPSGLMAVAIDALGDDPQARADADRVLVDGATLDDLLRELALVAGDNNASGYQFLRIAALLRLDAAAVGDAARQIADGAEPPVRDVLIGALGEAGTPAAQAALGDLAADPALADDTRVHAAASLGLVDEPTPATLARLASASLDAGELGTTATLALGNAALRVRDDRPALANEQVDTLLARLAGARDDRERALVLRALGNTGDPRIVPALEGVLGGGGAVARIAAAEALRFVPGTRPDELVIAALADDVELVRSAAVFAAGFRDLAVLGSALDRSLRLDPAVDVRRAIVELAAMRMDELPALRGLVAYAARHDRDAELRAAARALL